MSDTPRTEELRGTLATAIRLLHDDGVSVLDAFERLVRESEDEVSRLQAEVDRLTAENARIQRIAHAAGVIELAEALRELRDEYVRLIDRVPSTVAVLHLPLIRSDAALAVYEAARNER